MRSIRANPDFIPHEKWDEYAWLVPHDSGPEPWYYAAPTGQAPARRQVPTNPKFLKTVDPVIRPLVGWLHSKGIPTGPSCSGHDLEKREFGTIYANLGDDADRIRSTGLLLHDPEDGRDYVMQDDAYQLPWSTFDAFRKVADGHQTVGWLPFYTTDPRVDLVVGEHPGFEIKQTRPGSYGIHTEKLDADAWKQAGDMLRDALDGR